VFLIPLVVVVALLGFGMCRLAALSDSNHAAAVADWVATSCLPDHGLVPDHHYEQIPLDPRGGSFRAAG
jgi:hypothetical protein